MTEALKGPDPEKGGLGKGVDSAALSVFPDAVAGQFKDAGEHSEERREGHPTGPAASSNGRHLCANADFIAIPCGD